MNIVLLLWVFMTSTTLLRWPSLPRSSLPPRYGGIRYVAGDLLIRFGTLRCPVPRSVHDLHLPLRATTTLPDTVTFTSHAFVTHAVTTGDPR